MDPQRRQMSFRSDSTLKNGSADLDSPEDEKFEDAVEEHLISFTMDLPASIEETKVALNLFLNNKFELARQKMEPWPNEKNDIENAVSLTKQASELCDGLRHKPLASGLSASRLNKITGQESKSPTTQERMHAELIYAETLLQRALLSFIQDENLVSFVKGALKIRSCYQSYKDCEKYLTGGFHNDQKVFSSSTNDLIGMNSNSNGNVVVNNDQQHHQNDQNYPQTQETMKDCRAHFQSGVQMGIGAFNLLISILPQRVLKVLTFVGFTGEKVYGLQQLETGARDLTSLRGPLCSLALLTWHLQVNYVFGVGDSDLTLCHKLLASLRTLYPSGSIILYFAGRFAEVRGQFHEAIELLNHSVSAQSEWRQLHHVCFWELMFCHAFLRQWDRAAHYALKLFHENKWSKASYCYVAAIFTLCKRIYGSKNHGIEEKESTTEAENLLKQIPALKLKIAGKSIPLEKFCAAKSARYFRCDNRLIFPHYELLYLFNGFTILGENDQLVKPVLYDVESYLSEMNADVQHSASDPDDYYLCLLLKAMCLKYLQSPFQAEQCLSEIINEARQLTDNSYVLPCALFELSLMKYEDGEIMEAKSYLAKIREYRKYLMESRLHFRMHALNEKLAVTSPV
uniref:Tetratricopeptide repeat protein 39B n=1 Tax=Romanomermis culicivorax TaxID=13658 RepID=A0A915I025_ROMCU